MFRLAVYDFSVIVFVCFVSFVVKEGNHEKYEQYERRNMTAAFQKNSTADDVDTRG